MRLKRHILLQFNAILAKKLSLNITSVRLKPKIYAF